MGYVAILNSFGRATGIRTYTAIDVKGHSFDFPLAAKHRFGKLVRPYLLGGGVLRYVGPVRGRGEQTITSLVAQSSVTTPIDTADPSDLRKRWYPGLTAGGGVELPVGRLHLLPEFRYTRWTANIAGEGGSAPIRSQSGGIDGRGGFFSESLRSARSRLRSAASRDSRSATTRIETR